MSKLNTENHFFLMMGKLGDAVILNFLWIICCVPVLTIGASTTALFYVARRMANGEDYSVRKDFFHSFRQNWKTGTLIWLILLAVGVFSLADFLIGLHTEGIAGGFYTIVGVVLCLLWLTVVIFVFPLLSRYEYTLAKLIPTALFLGFANPQVTISGFALILWLPILAVKNINAFLFVFPLWLIVGGALSSLIIVTLLIPVFQRIEKSEPEGKE